jgi:hypothetical protein
MDVLLKRALGVYFIVNSLTSIPAGIAMIGVENPFGPSWILPAVPLAQGLITAVAGVWLYRSGVPAETGVVPAWPPIEGFLQLFGIYFVVGGLVSLARPVAGVLWFHETVGLSAGSTMVSAAASIAIGGCLVAQPGPLASLLRQRRVG